MLDFRPTQRGIAVLAGDSLAINCDVVEFDTLTNPVFTAQLRDGETLMESFIVEPHLTGALLRLTPEQTRRVYDTVPLQQVVGSSSAAQWRGAYDIQLAWDDDEVHTFLAGPFIIQGDVTRDV